ncbi:glycosyltransferase family 2 protein [Gordonibacter urolithinfaciens]|uniref:Glycosyltransferase n=1 Tax=Gordonibacter urolithinfaciens TaxID=1335613 RepID=A0A6N8IIA4_9ACTN|nr:glycosyltransferase family 2 protein [Gordonibacter urolithinfaciens]MVM54422.1 glycosyltransferase [Gordonibacter urolithinfaciens]MVN15100.1 glycosyltransferase [Gordonibacter urolithinfaciens]MVN39865.1 glycosyltransferase [Gordonibacter urolithinfaciens]MVN57194.1 glycosyltransferase [Gordonibacter urolithinfaciens]MVN62337.1 glycosyltransferase [Gordonibacter urolithinfaciens]
MTNTIDEPNVLVIVPAYNEEDSLEHTIKELLTVVRIYDQIDYVVVNDGSSDSTKEICERNKYPLLNLPVNTGLTTAFQTGMKYAFRKGYDYAVQFDADGQHDPRFLKSLLDTAREQQANIVIGSRFINEKKPLSMRMVGSFFISAMVRMTTGQRLTDPTSGMRLFDRLMIERFAKENFFAPEPDTIAFAMRGGAKVVESPVAMRERFAGSSYLTATKSIMYMMRMGVSILLLQWMREA